MFKNAASLARTHGARIAALMLATAGASAFATDPTTFDASTYVTNITATIAGLLLIGGAVFSVVLAIKSTKWARRAL